MVGRFSKSCSVFILKIYLILKFDQYREKLMPETKNEEYHLYYMNYTYVFSSAFEMKLCKGPKLGVGHWLMMHIKLSLYLIIRKWSDPDPQNYALGYLLTNKIV